MEHNFQIGLSQLFFVEIIVMIALKGENQI